jgi:hypothetical protein
LLEEKKLNLALKKDTGAGKEGARASEEAA